MEKEQRATQLGLLARDELPPWFSYPNDFLEVFEALEAQLEWGNLLRGDDLRFWAAGLAERYPARSLIPIVRSWASDDILCWDRDRPGCVVMIHDFASAGWEGFGPIYSKLEDWLDDVGVNWNELR